jgi:nonribosomal peptide synthetase DhbF
VLETLPMNGNGKVDRAAAAAAAKPAAAVAGGAPAGAGPLERRLHDIWTALLDDTPDGVDQDFFAAGGDSLAANVLLARVMAQTGTTLRLGSFLDTPTIRGLAGLVLAAGGRDR